ncbi:MAG: hypothetical protein M1825_000622 [Sarcosagium campestre]|nr:MAG: hypothetical protein M1825_000622 [Sarcosagium campestre]
MSVTSSRPSFSNPPSPSQSPRPTHAPPQPRRNRAALRDYYGLARPAAPSSTASADASSTAPPSPSDSGIVDPGTTSELDLSGFDPDVYVEQLLQRQGLEGVLRAESGLIGGEFEAYPFCHFVSTKVFSGRLTDVCMRVEIRALEGERSALVYDNYSKLISATDTIRKMRTSMDPLAPTTATLAPAMSHIAALSAALSTSLQEERPSIGRADTSDKLDAERQRAIVQNALEAPDRVRLLMQQGQADEAARAWKTVTALLDQWGDDVGGVQELRQQGELALKVD